MTNEMLEQLRLASVNETADNQKTIEDFFKKFTDQPAVFNISQSSDGYSVEVRFTDPNGKCYFGGNANFSYKGSYNFETRDYDKPELRADCCSAGMLSFKEDPSRTYTWHILAAVMEAREQVAAMFDSLPTAAYKAYREAYYEHQREVSKQNEEARKAKEEEVRTQLVQGYKFTKEVHTSWADEVYNYVVEKITPKRVYVRCDLDMTSKQDKWDFELRKVIGKKLSRRIEHYSGYAKFESVVSSLANNWNNPLSLDGRNTTTSTEWFDDVIEPLAEAA